MFFGVIAEAFKSWPHAHDFAPRDPEHLRAWLLVEAGYYDEIGNMLDLSKIGTDEFEDKFVDFFDMCMYAVRQCGYGILYEKDGIITLRMPKSIAFDTLDEKAFVPISTAVFEIIEMVLRLPVGKLKANTGNTA